MAQFKTALRKLLQHEGGFANNPNDAGGMTFCGISRVFWESDTKELWQKVDSILDGGEKPNPTDPDLSRIVEDFYRRMFWDKILGDRIVSQRIAEAVFDTAVQFNTLRAVTMVQQCLKLMFTPGPTVDGKLGSETVMLLNKLDVMDEDFIDLLRSARHAKRWERLKKDPTDIQFMTGWILNRDKHL